MRASIELVRGQLSDDDFKSYCKVMGTILADTQLELLRPYIYADYPDLAPQSPSDPEDREIMKRMEAKFAEASDRARHDSEPS